MHRPNVFLCGDLAEFMHAFRCGWFDDPHPATEEHPAWDPSNCQGDGFDRNPLLVAPGSWRSDGPVLVSGEIRDSKGHHPAATFLGGAHCRMADDLRRKRALDERAERARRFNRHAARERHENALLQMPRRNGFKCPA